MSEAEEIAGRLRGVRARIAAAAARAGRPATAIALVAVSKTKPAAAVEAAIAAGVTDVGENYAQEMAAKQAAVTAPVRWHYIGGLQRNKAKLVAGRVALVHAVDSRELIEAIGQRAAAAGAVQPILLSIRAGGADQRSGVAPEEARALVAAAAGCAGVRLDGLMTLPPADATGEAARPFFRALRELRDRLATAASPLPVLSMGMSGDFEVAIEEGSTAVRLGTAIFGARG